jgi:nucleoside transporter
MTPTLYLRLATMAFLHYFVWSCWFNTLGIYIGKDGLGFTDEQVGLAYGTMAIGAIFAPFIIGVVADRFFPAQRILGVLHITGAAMLWWISQQTTFGVFYPALIVYMLTYMASHGLINTITLAHAPNPTKWFPIVMTAATAGWICAGLLVSALQLEDNSGMFKLASLIALLMGLYSFSLPSTPPKSETGPASLGKILGVDAVKLLKEKSFAIFMLCSFLICIPLSFYFALTAPFLKDTMGQNAAAKMTLGQFSEIGFLLLLPLLLPRLGIKRILVIGMAAWAIRFSLFAFTGAQPSTAWMIYGGLLLHGVCYDFIFVSGRMYVDKVANNEIRASAQGLHAFFTHGIGMFVGTWLSGVVAQHYTNAQNVHDWKAIWLVPAIMSAALIPVFLALFREKPANAPSA